ncbi:uncharacterized protein LOC129984685 isoform X2 [Argiope bruennichi]|uniref:Uncharacterized protein n=1 Tax=Argiope bruennichi TaxID=94029 RepID=A0A8T0EGN2_ARGBR|nr:uncharacterized protein LOC129984685 isoform X2 [Argiope bruennichi]KAF8773002.1 hypothetical protein HNY73_015704 [Argiope bruennichi]
MENFSFEKDSTSGDPSKGRKDDPPELEESAKESGIRPASVDAPCDPRPDSPNVPPLPEPDQRPDDASDPSQQPARAPVICPTKWREACFSFYQRICTFSFQFPFHTLLLTWPLSTAIMGVLNLNFCRINPVLPFIMMAVGILGTAVVLLRLYTMHFERCVSHIYRTRDYWIGLRIAEFTVWNIFAIQLYYFFGQAPSFTPGEEHYCKWKFYKINFGLMLLTCAAMLGWTAVHVGKCIRWYERRNELASP